MRKNHDRNVLSRIIFRPERVADDQQRTVLDLSFSSLLALYVSGPLLLEDGVACPTRW
jgi:hypothetical protein